MNTSIEKQAIERIKAFEPEDGYYVCYSGGKDSDVIRILCQLAGVKHDLVNNHTTVDAPETVRYIRGIPNIQINMPEKTMWELIVHIGIPPTRLMRYCCSELKERGGKGRVKMTGVRWAESNNRRDNSGVATIIGKPKNTKKIAAENNADFILTNKGGVVLNTDNDASRRAVEMCYRTRSTMINPIVDWTDDEVWEFLRHYGCESNPLYQCGFKRIGCIGCPLASTQHRYEEFARYPKYKENYIKAFDRMLLKRDAKGYERGSWIDGKAVFKWWMEEDPNQINMFEEPE